MLVILTKKSQFPLSEEEAANLIGFTAPTSYVLANAALQRVVFVRKGRALTRKRFEYLTGDR